jgi:hypothetical protein
MQEIGKVITDFQYSWAVCFPEQVADDRAENFGDAVCLAVDSNVFDTSEEKTQAEMVVRIACKKFAVAEKAYVKELEARAA